MTSWQMIDEDPNPQSAIVLRVTRHGHYSDFTQHPHAARFQICRRLSRMMIIPRTVSMIMILNRTIEIRIIGGCASFYCIIQKFEY